MASRDYVKLPIEQFGRQLLLSGDLDPIYIGLHEAMKAGLSRATVKRWLVAYWCFYHAGVASYLSQFINDSFWALMLTAAENEKQTPTGERWPRGKERRHFRGEQGILAVQELRKTYPQPEDMVDYIFQDKDRVDYAVVANRAKEHRGFGDWISFKVCDMGERILGAKVDFTQAAVFMFADPVKAALRVWEERTKLVPTNGDPLKPDDIINRIVSYLSFYFKDHKAPPSGDRPVGLQEVETILCKWKSHMNGHYPLNNDLHEIRDGLEPWVKHSKVAKHFLKHIPEPK